jgi:hypothetical protein
MSAEPRLQSVPGTSWIGETDDSPTPPSSSVPGPSDSSAGAPPPGGAGGRSAGKARPERSIPTDRMRFEKQLVTLQTYAQLSGRTKQPVSADYLGKAMEMSAATAGLCGGFFKDSGWVERVGRAYAATDALLEYQRRINLDPDDTEAVKHLADAARDSWYWQAVEPMLGVGVRQNMVLVTLSQAANAHDHKVQLLLLIEWMIWLGLVRKDGETIYQVGSATATATAITAADSPDDAEVGEVATVLATTSDAVETPVDSATATVTPSTASNAPAARAAEGASSAALDPGALVSFNFSVRITAEDAAKLSAENIASLLEVVEKLRG